ncbi:MAG: hypothetical protein U0931_11715 [Vulcanimicrobiota bacterium]
MRTTVNIRDSLLQRLKLEAERSGTSLTEWINRAIEKGLERLSPQAETPTYRSVTFPMGQPNFDPDKALRYSAELEDEEILRKFHHRK